MTIRRTPPQSVYSLDERLHLLRLFPRYLIPEVFYGVHLYLKAVAEHG